MKIEDGYQQDRIDRGTSKHTVSNRSSRTYPMSAGYHSCPQTNRDPEIHFIQRKRLCQPARPFTGSLSQPRPPVWQAICRWDRQVITYALTETYPTTRWPTFTDMRPLCTQIMGSKLTTQGSIWFPKPSIQAISSVEVSKWKNIKSSTYRM